MQCDNPDCLKWRKLPDGTDPDKLPDKWYCKDNPNPNMRSCNIPEEKEEEIEQPYVKTQKKRLWVLFSMYFLGGKGGRRPVASVEFFGFENISFLNCIQSQSSIKLSRFQNAWALFLVGIYYYGAQAAAFLSDACQPEVSLFLV